MTEQSTIPTQPKSVTGTSLTSFDEATESAFSRVMGDPHQEGAKAAEVARMWVTAGGFVGHTQYHVELRILDATHVADAPSVEGVADLEPVEMPQ